MLTDQELIALVREKSPAELTPEQLAALRVRLRESPAIRDAVADAVAFEELLVESMSQVDFSAGDVLARQKEQAQPPASVGANWSLFLLLGGIAFISTVYLFAVMLDPHPPVAKGPPKKIEPPPTKPEEGKAKPAEKPADPVAPAENPPEEKKPADPANPPMKNPPAAPEDPKPMPAPMEPAPIVVPIGIAADKSLKSNLEVIKARWGLAEVALLQAKESPAFVEYEVQVKQAGPYDLKLRYADDQPRPVRIRVNGREVKVADLPATGARGPGGLAWKSAGEIPFAAGANQIRLETDGPFPQLQQLALVPPGSSVSPADPLGPAIPDGPWNAVLRAPQGAAPGPEILFEEYDPDKHLTTRQELQQWFTIPPGVRGNIFQRRMRHGECGVLEGVTKLRAPWVDGFTLRFAIDECERCRIHFYHGDKGVTLAYFRHLQDVWAAFATQRATGSPLPETTLLLGSDEGRAIRTEARLGGQYDLRYQNGHLQLCRGDIVLLEAPLADPPREVYFEGTSLIPSIQLVRLPPVSPSPELLPPARTIAAASLDWKVKPADGVKLEKQADGSLAIHIPAGKDHINVTAPHPGPTLAAIEWDWEEVAPGVGMYFDPTGNDWLSVVRCVTDDRTNKLAWVWSEPVHVGHEPVANATDMPFPGTLRRASVRMLHCGSSHFAWINPDGAHWGRLHTIRRMGFKNVKGIGIAIAPQSKPTTVKLKSVSVRELTALTSLANSELVKRAPAVPSVDQIGLWRMEVALRQPGDVDTADWHRACAVKHLGDGCSINLANALLDLLLNDARRRELPLDRQLAALSAATMITDFDASNRQKPVAELFFQAAEEASERGEHGAGSLLRKTMMQSAGAEFRQRQIVSESLVRWELLELLERGQFDAMQQLCRVLRFYHQQGYSRLIPWAEYVAARPTGGSAANVSPQWRHPLIEELSKDSYNVLAEFQAILDSQSPQEAARMIAQVDPQVAAGLAPSGDDKQLLLSVPVAFTAAIRHDPQLQTEIQSQFGALAQLRVRQAISEGNPQGVQLTTTRYFGTPSASEAHRWLGDRALSAGQFALALRHYEEAQAHASPSLKGELTPRARLTAAMLGQNLGAPVTGTVTLGELRLSAAEFEQLVTESREKAKSGGGGLMVRGAASLVVPNPTAWKIERRVNFDGVSGQNPVQIEHRHVRQFQVNWVDRQLGATQVGDHLFLSNRFHVEAFDLKEGKRLWQSGPPPGTLAKAHDWTLVAMRPLVSDRRVYVRMLQDRGPQLACLDRANGSPLWISALPSSEFVVSDPMRLSDALTALTVRRQEQGEYSLRLTTFDLESGQVIGHQPLIRLRDVWWERKVCEVLPMDDGFVAVLGGITLAADARGQLLWLRKSHALPAEEEPRWVQQVAQIPILHERRLYVAQPGCRSLECMEPSTGKLLWRGVIPDLEHVVGIAAGRIVVRTTEGLEGWDLTSGKLSWRQAISQPLDACAVSEPGGVLIARRIPLIEIDPAAPADSKELVPQLVWLDGKDGKITATTTLKDLHHLAPQIGAFYRQGDRLWMSFGKGLDDVNRELIEVSASGKSEETPAGGLSLAANDPGTGLSTAFRMSAEKLIPGWKLRLGEPGENGRAIVDHLGETGVLRVQGHESSPIVFSHSYQFAGDAKPKIKIKLGYDPQKALLLEFRTADKTVHSVELTDKSHPQMWKELTFDLPALAGGAGELFLVAVPKSAGQRKSVYWREIRLDSK